MESLCRYAILFNMKTLFWGVLVTPIFLGSCILEKDELPLVDELSSVDSLEIEIDTLPRVTGIGGIFFGSTNPEQSRKWYGENLGLAIDDYGSPFEFRNANNPEEINYLRWSPMNKKADEFKPSKKSFMINYRVQNIEGLIRKLKNNDVIITDSLMSYEYGKFVHIMDNDGNKIELWEPIDSVLTLMGGATTK